MSKQSTPRAHLSRHGSRLAIEPFTGDRGLGTVFFVRDADWITDAEVREGHRPPTVGCFDFDDEAEDFCRRVIEEDLYTVPHEANFVAWPALRERVRRVAH